MMNRSNKSRFDEAFLILVEIMRPYSYVGILHSNRKTGPPPVVDTVSIDGSYLGAGMAGFGAPSRPKMLYCRKAAQSP